MSIDENQVLKLYWDMVKNEVNKKQMQICRECPQDYTRHFCKKFLLEFSGLCVNHIKALECMGVK